MDLMVIGVVVALILSTFLVLFITKYHKEKNWFDLIAGFVGCLVSMISFYSIVGLLLDGSMNLTLSLFSVFFGIIFSVLLIVYVFVLVVSFFFVFVARFMVLFCFEEVFE